MIQKNTTRCRTNDSLSDGASRDPPAKPDMMNVHRRIRPYAGKVNDNALRERSARAGMGVFSRSADPPPVAHAGQPRRPPPPPLLLAGGLVAPLPSPSIGRRSRTRMACSSSAVPSPGCASAHPGDGTQPAGAWCVFETIWKQQEHLEFVRTSSSSESSRTRETSVLPTSSSRCPSCGTATTPFGFVNAWARRSIVTRSSSRARMTRAHRLTAAMCA